MRLVAFEVKQTNTTPIVLAFYELCTILKCSDDGVLHLKESCFWTFSIVRCFPQNTTYRKLDLFPSSGKMKMAPTVLVSSITGPQSDLRCLYVLLLLTEVVQWLILRDPTEQGPPSDPVSDTLLFLENIGRWTKSKNLILYTGCSKPICYTSAGRGFGR
jgi:hypothetical protein